MSHPSHQSRAFTLVELIVVITILAILSTIAFLSFASHSGNTRDSKRASDLASVTRKIGVLDLQGSPMLGFVTGSGSRITTGAKYSWMPASLWVDYEAGKINYTALGMKDSDFLDPDGDNYKIGISISAGSYYELAATLENEGTKKALVLGNFRARTLTGSLVSIVSSAGNTITIWNEDIGKLKRWDLLANGQKITNISTTWKIIRLDWVAPSTGNLSLKEAETSGLIATKWDSTKPVQNGSTELPSLPY